MVGSPHFPGPADEAAFREKLRKAGLANVERLLREGRYQGAAERAARAWLTIKKMEALGDGVAVTGTPVSPRRPRARRSARILLYAVVAVAASSIILLGFILAN